ncbi:hypothetical protein AGABI1DRAFT_71435 [Agaricus bisporus var. burnettii JB137-S8]|uniref:GPI mannosyltransferase 2 n=1 Tax=Agaricus bisporus var. burnettii (strain JB137-S8 / ATCC MYA-4627 / FGSC 10392) TaxID=597362 RepID=K5XC18_AGABU|nr:uncharacterized protein AGABI1DRAFT_71435 [Agaricus bisporus var. burnettii JB137-S8]EKM80848.1 hypothetical protein AGABI1DRAFT_71435 [Agaricus bisporus var. burnettii JB137-S8]
MVRAIFFRAVLVSRAVFLTVALAALTAVPTPFDASAPDGLFVRWDVLHFLDIARDGYRWEHNYAFLLAGPFLLRLLRHPALLFLVNTALAYDSSVTLYRLSLRRLRRKDLARLAALLALIPSSPATLYWAPYAEPFFTYLSYRGMFASARRQWLKATLFFTLAATFRSNGFFLAGFIIWPCFLLKPSLSTLAISVLSTVLILSPFLAHNFAAYLSFCPSSSPAPWCSNTIPLVYSHVQSVYWNVGFLKYWSLSQLPNFLLAFPLLITLFTYSLTYLFYFLTSTPSPDPFFNSSIAPHAIHALLMSSLLLFASHTQIVLRLAPSMPFTYWAAAYLFTHPTHHPFLSRLWLPWSLIWSLLSVILWIAFLPPA